MHFKILSSFFVSTSNSQILDAHKVASHISFLECTIAKRSISIFRGLSKRGFCPEVTMPPNHDVAKFHNTIDKMDCYTNIRKANLMDDT